MKRLFPRKFIIYQNCLLGKEASKQIIASCDRITDSNLIVNTETELNEIQKHDSKLIKDYLIGYAKDKGVFGGIYYEKNSTDEKVCIYSLLSFLSFKMYLRLMAKLQNIMIILELWLHQLMKIVKSLIINIQRFSLQKMQSSI